MFSRVANAPTLHIYLFGTRERRDRCSVPICTERTVKGFHPIILTSRRFIALFVTLHFAIQFFLSSTSSKNPSLHSLYQWNHTKLKITDEYRITYWPLVEIEFQSEWYVLIVDISNDLICVWRDCHVIIPQTDFFFYEILCSVQSAGKEVLQKLQAELSAFLCYTLRKFR